MNLYTYLEQLTDEKNIKRDGRNILIYHGLDGGIDNKKVSYLESKGFNVTMQKHDYRKEFGTKDHPGDRGKSFMKRQESIVASKKIDIIIGSSFGGYVAYLLGCEKGKDLILINPALNRAVTKTAIQEFDYPHNKKQANYIEYFHGSEDTVVTSTHSLEVLQRGSSKYKQIPIKGMGHTTPFAKFKKDICEVSEILKIPKEDKKEEEK
jgi:predicted esterase YcpF (UPF0227 family)